MKTIVEVFREVRRVLKADGTCWMNLGDSYAEKSLVGTPWRVALGMKEDGWYLRSDIIWHKPNPMPESVTDRPTKSHEYIFLFSKSESYYYDHESISERTLGMPAPTWEERKSLGEGNRRGFAQNAPAGCHRVGGGETRNKRSVWTVPTAPYKEAHFACYPPDLIKPCIMAGTKPGDVVLDPFGGSGTTGQVALELGRRAILLELNADYAKIIHQRTNVTMGLAL